MKNMQWTPFVPGVGANAQLVLDPVTGGTLNFILCAGWSSGNKIKTGQIFCQRKAHYLPSLQLHAAVHTIPRELAYIPNKGWKTDILADFEQKHVLKAIFQIRKDGGMQIRITAINKSKTPARWVVNLFSGINVPGKEIALPQDFKIFDTFNMHTSSPFRGGEHPDGLLADWGTLRDMKNYPDGLTPRYATINVPGNSQITNWILIGAKDQNIEPKLEFPKVPKQEKAFSHLAAQLEITRIFPMVAEGKIYPQEIFTPCAHMDWPFIWDAGFTACGLAVTNPKLAEECIASYLPDYPNSAWPCAIGATKPTQILAALELYQQTGNKEIIEKLYPGLHALWRKAVGLDTWNALRSLELDSDKDGLISAANGGSGIDDAPSQIWVRAEGVDWARQENYWTTPIQSNPTGKVVDSESVNLTSFAILSAKILQLFSQEKEFDNYIKLAEDSLQKYCWNEETNHFHWVTSSDHQQVPYYDLSGLTPLFSGTWKNSKQKKVILKELFSKYMTKKGLTTVWQEAPFYRNGYWCGAIWIPFHWMFWKFLIGEGLFKEAKIIATRILKTWQKAYNKFPVNYEKFDLETGDGSGSLEFGALAAVLLNLYAAYNNRETKYRCLGWNTIPEKWEVSPQLDKATLYVKSTTDTALRIMLNPKKEYLVTVNGKSKKLCSDNVGGLNIHFTPGKNEIFIKEK